ncbi:LPS export ABC transporter protein LptC [Syntrophus gentianae]|uniref:LPS export ABC transporter protein LptC n=1 Tax=Syntrophus gentianae TaxID=43775 RepID=A0A1H7WXP5_9BACT|nr:LPS export ABC transporter protein LptC [Syntrophus gentianae]
MKLKKLIELRKKRLILSAGCLAVLLILAGIVYTVTEKTPRKTPLKIMDDQVDLQVMNVHYTEATEEGVTWEVHADSAQYRKKENLAVFKSPKIKLMMPNGRSFVLSGKEGYLHQDSKDMELSGDVQLASNNGDSFKTDLLKYSGSEKRCYTNSPVSFRNSRIQVDAKGMSISLKDEHLSLLSGVKAYIHK